MCYVQESYEVTCTPVYLRLYRPAACTFEHHPPNVYTCINITSTDKTSSGVYGSPIHKAGDIRIIEQEFALTVSIKN